MMMDLIQGIKWVSIELCVFLAAIVTWWYTDTRDVFPWLDKKPAMMKLAITLAMIVLVFVATYAICYLALWFWIDVMHMKPMTMTFDSSSLSSIV